MVICSNKNVSVPLIGREIGPETMSQDRGQIGIAIDSMGTMPSSSVLLYRISRQTLLTAAILVVAGCGRGGGAPAVSSDNNPPSNSDGNSAVWVPDVFEPAVNFENRCVVPRTGTDPRTGGQFPDVTGTTLDENNWLRSWSNDLYLWYDEIVDQNPADFTTAEYFEVLKTSEITPSGNPKDRFHFSLSTEEWHALSQSGVSAGYGATFSVIAASPPRQVVVAYTEPNSPATTGPVNLARGASILAIDGVDMVEASDDASVAVLNAGLFPSEPGESHEFTVQDLGSSTSRSFSMVSATITSVPVQNVDTVATSSGAVGYMLFNDHIATSEQQLMDAVDSLLGADITDLVVDLRYNSGGFLDIANELAYMVAGAGPTAGQTFDELRLNDKHTVFNPVTGRLLQPTPFHTTALGFSAPGGQNLPTLDLSRVFVLTGPGTCSASEAFINGLRGVDVEVIQIGSTTCGKPYGFYEGANCGTSYFSIQFKGVNAKGFGDYTDGFSPENVVEIEGTPIPGCSVADDFTHALGDRDEARLSAALAYRIDQSCPSPSGLSDRTLLRAKVDLSAVDGHIHKSPWLTNRIMGRR